jgi:hypothetical protein
MYKRVGGKEEMTMQSACAHLLAVAQKNLLFIMFIGHGLLCWCFVTTELRNSKCESKCNM